MVYAAQGQEPATHEDLNAEVFVHIYTMLAECDGLALSENQLTVYWAPVIAQIRRMRGDPEADRALDIASENGDVDVEMEGNDEGSDWELGSGVGSEEDEGGMGFAQDGADGAQGENETDGVQGEEA